ncbi:MAG: phage virion morphogenesis protein [Prevotellaceae bacterium]|jgi:phage gpG-like protein|nr:phage virion morphogenesis protein [Prevotellaceae bacterium]
MTHEEFLQDLERIRREIDDYANDKAPDIIGTTAVNFFDQHFLKEGFINNGLNKWPDVKRRTEPEKNAPPSDKTRKILTKSGNLRRSLSHQVLGNGKVEVSSDLPYAKAHNEGTSNAGRSRNVVIPKRQFIGDSIDLDKLAIEEIERKLKSLKKI